MVSIDTVLKIVEIGSVLGGGAVVAFRLGRTTARVEETLLAQNMILEGQTDQVTELKNETKKVNDVLTKIAVQENRLDRIEEDIQDIRHGRIKP